MVVTRVEVADAVAAAFLEDGFCVRDDLVRAADDAGAREEVLVVLGRLSARRFQRLPELWSELGHLPVEPEEVGA